MYKKPIDAGKLDIETKVIEIRRVTKVVKGGRNFRFAALVVCGDHNGHVGIGTGKAMEVPEAIRKAEEDAKKSIDQSTNGWNYRSSPSKRKIWSRKCFNHASKRRYRSNRRRTSTFGTRACGTS